MLVTAIWSRASEAAFQARIGIDVDRFGAEQTHAFSLGIIVIVASEIIDAPEYACCGAGAPRSLCP